MTSICVVVVSYNSREQLRACVEGLTDRPGIEVVVADNASPDGSLDAVADLRVSGLQLDRNGGFAFGCNAGWRAGAGDYVLFLNPDARLPEDDLRRLASVLDAEPGVGAVGPRILHSTGELDFSQRRFPRLRSTYAQALFLHRIFPRALWADETVRRAEDYERPGPAEWISGACMLVRRSALEELGRARRGLLPLLRGHRPLQAPVGRGPRGPLRAGRDVGPRGRRLRSAGIAHPGARREPGALRGQAFRPGGGAARADRDRARGPHALGRLERRARGPRRAPALTAGSHLAGW